MGQKQQMDVHSPCFQRHQPSALSGLLFLMALSANYLGQDERRKK
jgi:hypothetical protein